MDTNTSTTRFRYRLLSVIVGILLIVQACSAYNLKMDIIPPSHDVTVGQHVVIYVHLYDTDYPGVALKNGYGGISVYNSSGVRDTIVVVTNESGWASRNYIPRTAGKYWLDGRLDVNYNDIPGVPPAGILSISTTGQSFNATTLFAVIPRTAVIYTYVTMPSATVTIVPLTTAIPAATTGPVTSALAVQPATTAIPVTPAQAAPVPPVISSDSTPPVTTLSLAGTEDGSGGFTSEVICTLTAADNEGGSGVGTIQYSFDGATWYAYTKPVSVIRTGMTTLYYRSADNAGNTEMAKVKAIVISGQGAVPVAAAAPGSESAGTAPAAIISPAGSGSPVPLWLAAIIVFILLMAAGAGLYLKSRRKGQGPKQ